MAIREKMKDGTTKISGGTLTLADIQLAIHPINSLYLSVDPGNPAALFGGTWIAWGSGRVPVGVDAAQTEFDTVEEIGGNKLETISIAQMPSHDHGGSTTAATTDADFDLNIAGTNPAGLARIARGGATSTATRTIQSSSHSHPISPQGSGLGHNNLQPYITCYMWKRTA